MLNIMLYGFNVTADIGAMKTKIDGAMKELGFENNAITTIVSAFVWPCGEEKAHAPFIRVCSTDLPQARKVVGALKMAKVGVLVESLILSDSIPATEMR
ncbi:MAG: hypothetical protein Q7R98_00960 [Candidatus Jorgensenbacteria bacterium]|nr:hypothetical protein [Candidatus Jorgensenbacteria bacterium]